ncbi:C4-type zinc ribbon domain-containing protein [soil metagenome]
MALKAAPEDQALLLDLQLLDTKLQQLGHKASTLPEIAVLASLTTERETLQRTLANQNGAWEDAQLELKRTESDVAVVEARVTRDKERLQASASVKDVAALEQELAALAKRQSDLEDIELAVMETVDETATAVETTRSALTELDGQIAEAMASRDAALVTLTSEREHAGTNRAAIAAQVPADLLALYEKQRARYGVGASLLQGGVSKASGVTLNASDMVAIRAAAPDDVLLCPDSNAVLVRTAESGL